MNLGKGLGLSAGCALVGAAVWAVIITKSGLDLWLLAPIVGGAAGFGMMRGTEMRGGAAAGVLAALVTLVAIVGARVYIVSEEAQKQTAVTEVDALERLAKDVATDMNRRRIPTLNENGEYSVRVKNKAYEAWTGMSDAERQEFLAARQKENLAALGALTPALMLDFGLFGAVLAALAAGTAFKTGSVTLEKALEEKGKSSEEAAELSAKMRSEESTLGASVGGWGPRMAPEDKRPVLRVRVVSSDDDAEKKDDGAPGRQDAA